MRVAAIYDIHGNLPALDAALEDIRLEDIDLIVVGGDVLPGPMPLECLARLLDLDIPTRFIQGNGDRESLAERMGSGTGSVPEQYREVMRWTARQLDPESARIFSGWPKTVELEIDGLGATLFCHATPRSDVEIFTKETPEERLAPVFDGLDAAVVVCGHTHMQFDRKVGDVRVVNAGSVGMPYGEPGAYWVKLGPDVDLRRTPYDLERAAERIRCTGYPQAADFAERNVLHPPTEEAILKAFASTKH